MNPRGCCPPCVASHLLNSSSREAPPASSLHQGNYLTLDVFHSRSASSIYPSSHAGALDFPSRIMWPRNLSCLCLILLIISLLVSALCKTLSFEVRSILEIRSMLRKNYILAASILFSITLPMFHASHPYNNVDQTYVFKFAFVS